MPPPLDEATRERLFFAWIARPNITALASQFTLTRVTVRRWKRLDRWEERRDILRQQFVRNGMQNLEGLAQEYERLCQALLHDFAQRVESGDVKVENVGELLTLAKTQLMLRGEPTERVGVHYTLASGVPIEQASRQELDEEAVRLAKRIAGYQKRLGIEQVIDVEAVEVRTALPAAGDNGTEVAVVTEDTKVTTPGPGKGTAAYGDLDPERNGAGEEEKPLESSESSTDVTPAEEVGEGDQEIISDPSEEGEEEGETPLKGSGPPPL